MRISFQCHAQDDHFTRAGPALIIWAWLSPGETR